MLPSYFYGGIFYCDHILELEEIFRKMWIFPTKTLDFFKIALKSRRKGMHFPLLPNLWGVIIEASFRSSFFLPALCYRSTPRTLLEWIGCPCSQRLARHLEVYDLRSFLYSNAFTRSVFRAGTGAA